MSYTPGLVSVLIPLFNRAKYIQEAINSALSQEYDNLEIIVVDDGSTDGGDKLVEAFFDTGRVQLFRHAGGANRGQSISLNVALSKARGEYIAVLDSDDIFLPNKLKDQVGFLQANPDVGLVYGMGFGVDAAGKQIYNILSEKHTETNDPNRILLDCYFHLPVGSLVRKSVYDQVGGFDESLRAGQDHDMQVRMAEVTRFGFLPVRVYCYRRHGESISHQGLERRWRNALIILNKAINRYPYSKSTIRKRRAVINFRLAQALLQSKKSYWEAGWRFLYAGLLDPARAIAVVTRKEKVR
ncbi:glycosyltransferase [Cellvibrio sp. KY-YJ-3]|uniref:glycosyltransferase family 2 protein n=1 Tax=Cellvibrio sp. KY-YJ-3 TaxID=454662 RepID=UPI00177ADBD3|nr:glycosyltransferase [Cellvibrio sp. KY-YJ-3]